MTVSSKNDAPPKSTKSRNSNSSVQVRIQSFFSFVFVLRDTEKSEFLDSVDFGGVSVSVESVIPQSVVPQSVIPQSVVPQSVVPHTVSLQSMEF